MHICFVANAASPHTVRWVEYFRDNGWRVTVISHQAHEIVGTTVILTDLSLKRFPISLGKFRSLIRRLKPDIVHGHQVLSEGLYAVCSGYPAGVSAWGSDILLTPALSRLHRYLTHFVLSRACVITADSFDVERAISWLSPGSVSVLQVPMGPERSALLLPTVPAGERPPVVVSPRSLYPVYRVGDILRAFHDVLHTLPEARLHLYGSGPEQLGLSEMARRLSLGDSVRFLGAVPRVQLLTDLRSASVMVSIPESDATAASLLEAMALGALPVVTDLPSNREWITDGKNGLVVSVGDISAIAEALRRGLSDTGFREQACFENRALIEARAVWEECIKPVEFYYRKLARP